MILFLLLWCTCTAYGAEALPHVAQESDTPALMDTPSPLPTSEVPEATAAKDADQAPHQEIERTLAIIKPHIVSHHLVGRILSLIEDNAFTLVALKLQHFTLAEAQSFYAEHADKPFFATLTAMMSSAPSIVMVLERTDGIAAWRELAGATDPHKARPGTIRAMYGVSSQENAVHGSDSSESATREIAALFPELTATSATPETPAAEHQQKQPEEQQGQVLSHQEALALLDDDAIPTDVIPFDQDDSLSLTLPEITLQKPPVTAKSQQDTARRGSETK